jgi:peptidoglycan/LPS O-acetylase OafA/YrhL
VEKAKPQKEKLNLSSLDGWRALSIALVLLAHSSGNSQFPIWLKSLAEQGSLGVRFFFVISGFLITWLLLMEKRSTGSICLKAFYIRRVLRIFPVYFLYLLIIGTLTPYSQPLSVWLANVTFTTNFHLGLPKATEHLWSLGVEEQFYLIWPGLLYFILKSASVWAFARILMIPLIVAPIARFLVWANHPGWSDFLFQGYSFFCNFDVLTYGCIAALIFHYRPEFLRFLFEKAGYVVFVSGIMLILIPIVIGSRHWIPSRLGEMIFYSVQAVGFTTLLLHSIMRPQWMPYRILNWSWVRHLGVLSYSIYIWQQIFWSSQNVFGIQNAWWAVFPVWILVALLAAHASYYLLERPLLGLRAKFRVA